MTYCKIANHELYSISSDGKVYSGKLDILLKPRKNKNGYLIVTLDGKQIAIHRLVALHFLPNPYGYSQVNHKDGNKENNNISNLEWCTCEQNIHHALEHNLRRGFIHTDVKRKLLKEVLNGKTVLELSKDFPKTHPNTLNKMLRDQAIKDNLLDEWTKEAQRKRRIVAIKNLEKINAKNK